MGGDKNTGSGADDSAANNQTEEQLRQAAQVIDPVPPALNDQIIANGPGGQNN